ncbi:nuclear transport factor 2 family protein [Hwanghaeella sp.]|uniref:nuclear transport factor 2 family protein n=1 Tax=Hwanghaeella sp. TaxID=2605943 RepID=UPI003CCB7E99
MNLVSVEEEGVFRRLMEAYFGCYLRRDLVGLRALHVTDGDFVHFDHEFDRDSLGLADFLKKAKRGFDQNRAGRIDFAPVEASDFRAYADDGAGLMIATIRKPHLSNVVLRASFVLRKERGAWRFRHVHFSQDPNSLAELAVAS